MAPVNVRLTVYQACLGFIPGFALPEFVQKIWTKIEDRRCQKSGL